MFSECDESHWGLNCANICKCGQGALRCDRSKGCVCKNGWSEPSCNVDVDECAQTPNVCNDVNKECTNTIGSYECSCRDGFQLDQNEMCEGNRNEIWFDSQYAVRKCIFFSFFFLLFRVYVFLSHCVCPSIWMSVCLYIHQSTLCFRSLT